MSETRTHGIGFILLPLLAWSVSCGPGASQSEVPAKADNVPGLTRFATGPLGCEMTGIYVAPSGDFFFSIQHPSDTNKPPHNKATIGVVKGVDMNRLPAHFADCPLPRGQEKQGVKVALGQFQIIARQGDKLPGMPYGLGALLDAAGETVLVDSDKPDLNIFLPGQTTDDGYLFTNWESFPGGMSRLKINRDARGTWSVQEALWVDFLPVQGTFSNCFGSLSPWDTPLTSEEFFPDDESIWYARESAAQLNILRKHINAEPNPYRYGYIVEIREPASENPRPVKHYAMGRFSHENAVVMPDRRTVYLSDDGAGGVFFKFVADAENDLSAGILYAAKLTQDRDSKGKLIGDVAKAGFAVAWIELAHGSQEQVEAWISEYDQVKGSSKSHFLAADSAEKWARGEAADDRAAFLSSRSAAKAKGASAEFNKLEGLMINITKAATGEVPWLAAVVSSVTGTMCDGVGDIQLKQNYCGVVYRMWLDKGFDIHRMEPLVVGGPFDRTRRPNPCPADNIANPDNVQVLPDGRLIIAEDGVHENDMIWVFTPEK